MKKQLYVFCTFSGILVGYLENETDEYVEASDVMMMSANMTKTQQIIFVPFPPYFNDLEEKTVKIFKTSMLCKPYRADSELENQYIEFKSGLTLVKTGDKNASEEKIKKVFVKGTA